MNLIIKSFYIFISTIFLLYLENSLKKRDFVGFKDCFQLWIRTAVNKDLVLVLNVLIIVFNIAVIMQYTFFSRLHLNKIT